MVLRKETGRGKGMSIGQRRGGGGRAPYPVRRKSWLTNLKKTKAA